MSPALRKSSSSASREQPSPSGDTGLAGHWALPLIWRVFWDGSDHTIHAEHVPPLSPPVWAALSPGEGLAAATDKALKFLAGYGISEERVSATLGKPKQEWTSEDIAHLRGMASQLKDGQAMASQLFPDAALASKPPSPQSPRKKGRLPKNDKSTVVSPPSASLLPAAATPAQIEGILQQCLDKGIDLELILKQWQVSRLEDLAEDQINQVEGWLKTSKPIQPSLAPPRTSLIC